MNVNDLATKFSQSGGETDLLISTSGNLFFLRSNAKQVATIENKTSGADLKGIK